MLFFMAVTQCMIIGWWLAWDHANFVIRHNFKLDMSVLGNHDNHSLIVGNNGGSIALSCHTIVRNTRIELRFYCIAYCIAMHQVTNSNYLVLHSGHPPFILSAGLRPDCTRYCVILSCASRKFACTNSCKHISITAGFICIYYCAASKILLLIVVKIES